MIHLTYRSFLFKRDSFERGFTIVELLVVIATTSFLAGLLLTTLAATSQKEYQMQCMSNLKKIGIAFALYNGDYNNFFPPLKTYLDGNGNPTGINPATGYQYNNTATNIYWTKALKRYLPLQGIYPTSKANAVFICPSAIYVDPFDNIARSGNDLSLTYTASGTLAGFNPLNKTQVQYSEPGRIIPRNAIYPIFSPSKIVLVVDGHASMADSVTHPIISCAMVTSYGNMKADLITPGGTQRLWIDFRHSSSNAIDVLYGDCSVRPVKTAEALTTWPGLISNPHPKAIWENN